MKTKFIGAIRNHTLLFKRFVIIFFCLIALLLSILCIQCNARLYYPVHKAGDITNIHSDIFSQLKYIKKELLGGSADRMQLLFPEGYFFSYVLYGLTWVNLGLQQKCDSELHTRAISEARWALKFLNSPNAYKPFPQLLSPSRGIFYQGWKTRLLGGILLLSGNEHDIVEMQSFRQDCQLIGNAFRKSSTPFLCSYNQSAWPCDSVVALSVLQLHDSLFPAQYQDVIKTWLQRANKRLDPETDMLPHLSDPDTGMPVTRARGTSSSIISWFLYEIDPEFGLSQYVLFRKQFLSRFLGLPGIREYPKGSTGIGDVDSGPLIAGISASATVVAAGAAILYEDKNPGYALHQTVEMAGLPVLQAEEKYYAFGFLPLGETFLAWSRTAVSWFSKPLYTTGFSQIPGPCWRFPVHIISLLFICIVWFPLIFNIPRYFLNPVKTD